MWKYKKKYFICYADFSIIPITCKMNNQNSAPMQCNYCISGKTNLEFEKYLKIRWFPYDLHGLLRCEKIKYDSTKKRVHSFTVHGIYRLYKIVLRHINTMKNCVISTFFIQFQFF